MNPFLDQRSFACRVLGIGAAQERKRILWEKRKARKAQYYADLLERLVVMKVSNSKPEARKTGRYVNLAEKDL